MQEVFLRLWRKAHQFDPARGTFSMWFMAIARHHLTAQAQRRGRERRLAAADEIDALLADAAGDAEEPDARAVRRERGEVVLRALRALPEEQRRVLVLGYFTGLSQSAIAAQLGIPLGTVKKRVRLGVQKLRAALADELGDAPRLRVVADE